MKQTIAALLVLLAVGVSAQQFEVLRESCTALAGTSSVTRVNNSANTGRILAFRAGSTGGSTTVRVYTVVGQGTSYGTAQTIVAPTVCTPAGLNITFPTNTYLMRDQIVVRFDNAAITAAVDATSALLIEQ